MVKSRGEGEGGGSLSYAKRKLVISAEPATGGIIVGVERLGLLDPEVVLGMKWD